MKRKSKGKFENLKYKQEFISITPDRISNVFLYFSRKNKKRKCITKNICYIDAQDTHWDRTYSLSVDRSRTRFFRNGHEVRAGLIRSLGSNRVCPV